MTASTWRSLLSDQSAVLKHVYVKLSGEEKHGRKRYKSNKLQDYIHEWIVKKTSIYGLHEKWTEASVRALRASTHRCFQDRSCNCRSPSIKHS